MQQFLKDYSQEVKKTVMKLNCNRGLRRYGKNYETGNTANKMIRVKNWTNQRRGFEEFSSGHSVNLRSARYRGAIAVLTYVCDTMEVYKQGTPEVHFTSRRCISYVRGTPVV